MPDISAILILAVFIALWGGLFLGYLYGHSEGRRDGIREFYAADDVERFELLLETRQ